MVTLLYIILLLYFPYSHFSLLRKWIQILRRGLGSWGLGVLGSWGSVKIIIIIIIIIVIVLLLLYYLGEAIFFRMEEWDWRIFTYPDTDTDTGPGPRFPTPFVFIVSSCQHFSAIQKQPQVSVAAIDKNP
jgi:hypothetical protein